MMILLNLQENLLVRDIEHQIDLLDPTKPPLKPR